MKKDTIESIIGWLMIGAMIWLMITGILFSIDTWDVPVTTSMRWHAFWPPCVTLTVLGFVWELFFRD